MDDIQKSIFRNLKSGDYYHDALEWYSFNYVYPASQRIFIALILTLIMAMTSILFSTYKDGTFGTEEYFYFTSIKDETKQKLTLTELTHPISEQLAVAEFMLKKYVSKYEVYDTANITQQIDYIRRNSSKSVLKSFFKDIQNFENDAQISQNKDFIKIMPQNINIRFLLDQNQNAEEAEVTIKSMKMDYAKGEQVTIDKKVFLRFELTNIKDIIEYQKPLIFQVNEYRIIDK